MAGGVRRMFTVRPATVRTRRAIITMRAVRRALTGSIRVAVIIIMGVRVGEKVRFRTHLFFVRENRYNKRNKVVKGYGDGRSKKNIRCVRQAWT